MYKEQWSVLDPIERLTRNTHCRVVTEVDQEKGHSESQSKKKNRKVLTCSSHSESKRNLREDHATIKHATSPSLT